MATVKLSEELIRAIKHNVARPFEGKYRSLMTLSNEESIVLYNRMVTPQQQEALKLLPDDYHSLGTAQSCNIIICGSDDKTLGQLTLTFSQDKLVLYTWRQQWSPGWKKNPEDTPVELQVLRGSKAFIISVDTLQKWSAKAHDIFMQMRAILAERDAFLAEIQKVIESSTTLNQALKLWPGITRYTPTEYITRLNAKVERKTAAEISLGDDTLNKLNVAHIKQLMTA